MNFFAADVSIINRKQGEAILQSLQILYNGLDVAQVTETEIVIWNSGNQTIKGEDIVVSDVIRLEYPSETIILQVDNDFCSRSVIGVSHTVKNASVRLSFDFLDPGDAFRIKITHSAVPGQVTVAGTVKGLPLGLQRYKHRDYFDLTGAVALLGIMVFLIGATIVSIWTTAFEKGWLYIARLFVCGALVLLFVTVLPWLIKVIKARVRRSLPVALTSSPVLDRLVP